MLEIAMEYDEVRRGISQGTIREGNRDSIYAHMNFDTYRRSLSPLYTKHNNSPPKSGASTCEQQHD